MGEKFKVSGERPTVAKKLLDKHWKRSIGSYGDAHECRVNHSDKGLLSCHLSKWEKNHSGKVQVSKLIDFQGSGKYVVVIRMYTESESIQTGADTSQWGYLAVACPSYEKAISMWEFIDDYGLKDYGRYYYYEMHPIIIELPQ